MSQNSEQRSISRRRLLMFGASTVGATSLTAWLGTGAIAKSLGKQTTAQPTMEIASDPGVSKTNLTPDQAIQKLIDGNQRFVNQKRTNPDQDLGRLHEVSQGQAPFAAILSCADSRVVPEIAFDQGIGDLFVVRVAGNIANVEGIASEEYGTYVLGAKVLMVLGHERCGAVKAATEKGDLPGVIDSLVHAIAPAVAATEGKPGDRLENAVKANVLMQVTRLKTSPVLSKLVDQGQLKIVGGYYDLDTGKISLV